MFDRHAIAELVPKNNKSSKIPARLYIPLNPEFVMEHALNTDRGKHVLVAELSRVQSPCSEAPWVIKFLRKFGFDKFFRPYFCPSYNRM